MLHLHFCNDITNLQLYFYVSVMAAIYCGR